MRLIVRAIVLLTALVLASCGGSDSDPERDARQARAHRHGEFPRERDPRRALHAGARGQGVRAELQASIGPREQHQSRRCAEACIDMYPEYVGVLLSEIHGVVDRPESPRRLPAREEVTRSARASRCCADEALKRERAGGAEDGRRPAALRQHRRPQAAAARRAAGRLAGVPQALRGDHRAAQGVWPEGRTKTDSTSPRAGATPQLDERQDRRAASVFTTDSQLAADRYTLLDDPKGVFAKHHVVPLISRKILAEHGPAAARDARCRQRAADDAGHARAQRQGRRADAADRRGRSSCARTA